MMTDEQILELSYKNPREFAKLFDKHYKRFLNIAKKDLRGTEDAEDVVQEVFIKIYKYGKKLDIKNTKFIPWSNTILKNCIADKINSYKKASVELTEEIENTTKDPNEQDFLGEKNYINFVLDKISRNSAEIINLRYILGKSFKEIAKILNISNSTARVRIHRSKKEFIEKYKQYNNKYEY